jgi:outer membrane receptor for ferrienterochelin and colicins
MSPIRAALALWTLSTVPLAAQSAVFGTVTDSAGAPLAGARVHVVATTLTAVTDSGGRYRIANVPAGAVTLRVTLIGYFPETRPLPAAGPEVQVDFRLRPTPFLVNPVIVTAAKRSQLLDQATTSVSVVSERQLARRAVNTVDEAVDKAPGVQFINGQVNLRGSSGFAQGLGSRVLLLVDGVPANQGDRDGINWDVVPVDQIERVEVVKGAGSALYGSSAFGGVVNLITRELPEGWQARIRTTAGVFGDPPQAAWRFRDYTGIQDGIDVGGSYGRPELRGGLSLGARHSDGYRQQDRADHWQATGKAEWRPEPATVVNLSGAWASDQYQVPEPWCELGHCDDRGLAFQPFLIDTANAGNRTRSDKGYVTALVTRTPSERTAWLARGSWLRTHFTDVYPGRRPPFAPADFSIANRLGLEGRLVSRPDTLHVVTVGAEITRSDVLSNIFSGDTTDGGQTHTQGEYAAYAEAEQVAAGGALRLTFGARGDFLAIDGGGITAFVSPRAGAVWQTPTGSWRASLGRAYRAPSLAERFVTTYALGFRVVPNPALRAEEGWSGEVGRSWTPRAWLHGDAALFWTEARHLVEPAFTPALVIQFQNLQRARLVGLDLSVTATPLAPHLVTSLAYQYLEARELGHDTVPSRPLAYRPRHLLTLSADYGWRGLSVGADFRYSSRFERQDQLFPADPRLAVKVLDLRAGWTIGPVAAHLKVANALNYIYNLAPRVLEPVRTATLAVTYTY